MATQMPRHSRGRMSPYRDAREAADVTLINNVFDDLTPTQ